MRHVDAGAMRRSAALLSLLLGVTVAGGDDGTAAERPVEGDEARVVRIAVCQIFCIDGDADGNLRRIEYALEDAAAQHGEVLAQLVTQAAEWSQCPVVGVNCVGRITNGPWAGRPYGGQSAVADCGGSILAVLRDRDAEVRVLEVPVVERSGGATPSTER